MMLLDKVIQRRNGAVQLRRHGRLLALIGAELPTTRVTPEAQAMLSSLVGLRHLDLCGRHLPTDMLGIEDVAALAQSCCLTVQGAYLSTDELASLLRGLTGLRSLNLAGCAIDVHVLDILSSMGHLDVLTLGIRRGDAEAHRYAPPWLEGATLARLAKCCTLRELGLRGRDIGAVAVMAIAELRCLQRLDLGETDMDDAVLAPLASAGTLRELDLDGTSIGDSSAPLLAGLGVERLNIARTRFRDEGIALLLDRHDWRALDLSVLPISATALQHLRRMARLESLTLDITNALPLFESANTFPCLRQLSLRATEIDEVLIRKIGAACPALRELTLGAVPAAALHALAELQGLDTLAMGVIEPGVKGWQTLSAMDSVRELTVSAKGLAGRLPSQLCELYLSEEISREAMAAIHGAHALERLVIDDAAQLGQLDNDGQQIMSGLRDLVAEHAGLNDAGLALLSRLPQCEALYISGNPLSEQGLTVLDGHPLLHTLELRDSALGDGILPTLLSLQRLHCLDIAGSAVTSEGLARLAAGPNLQSLGIDGHQFDGAAVAALSRAPLLLELYLYPPFDTPAIERLRALPQVREIRLIGVLLENEGAAALADMTSLRSVLGNGATVEAIALLRTRRPDIWLRLSPIAAASKPGRMRHEY